MKKVAKKKIAPKFSIEFNEFAEKTIQDFDKKNSALVEECVLGKGTLKQRELLRKISLETLKTVLDKAIELDDKVAIEIYQRYYNNYLQMKVA